MPTPSLSQLKSRGQLIKPTIRLGKSGLSPEFLAAFDAELTRAELIKLRFEDLKDERKTVSKELAEKSGSQLVMQVGHTAVYFRQRAADSAF